MTPSKPIPIREHAKMQWLARIPATRRCEAEARYEAQIDLLFDRLQHLYGSSEGFERWFCDLLAELGQLHAARSSALLALDHARQRNRAWFLGEGMLGYCAYVDRFAGTLAGLHERIPYLQELGVSYLHLLPFLKMRRGDNDGGFAVSSFEDVEPCLGTMAELEALAAHLRDAGISLCADFVLNHVADDHAWAQAAANGDPHYRNYFHIFPDRSLPDAFEANLGQVFPEVAPGNFTHVPALDSWVWTTFYPFQWDLNYGNRAVFAEIAKALVSLANRGVEVFRLDSAPFLWKRASTACVNQPEVHLVLQALRSVVELACPGVLLKAEAIVPVGELPPYFGTGEAEDRECHLAYHSSLMAAGWAAVAEQKVDLLSRVIDATPCLPPHASWLTYVRCHDDIVWSALKPEIEQGGQTLDERLLPVSKFLAGQTSGSYARGAEFQAAGSHAVFGTNGMAASLVGFDSAGTDIELAKALARLRLLYALSFCMGGLPLIYMGDELAQGNDLSDKHAALRSADGRWLQRPPFDETRAARRHDPASAAGQAWAMLRELAGCRRRLPMLSADETRRRVHGAGGSLLILERGAAFIAVMNFSDEPKPLDVSRVLSAVALPEWFDCFDSRPMPALLELNPWDVRWFERRPYVAATA